MPVVSIRHALGAARTKLTNTWLECGRASSQQTIKWAPRGKSISREPESLVLRALRDIRADVAETKAELKSEMRSLGAAVASDFLTVNTKIEATRKELSDQIVGLRRAVVEYHSAVVGHEVLISELEARLRRVEQHLNLAAGDA